jgi:hypothetical protein
MYGKFNIRILVLGVHLFYNTYCRVWQCAKPHIGSMTTGLDAYSDHQAVDKVQGQLHSGEGISTGKPFVATHGHKYWLSAIHVILQLPEGRLGAYMLAIALSLARYCSSACRECYVDFMVRGSLFESS